MTANSQDSFSDNKLIQLCIKQDDAKAKKALYKRYYSYSFSVALRYAVSEQLAAEIVNDSFVKLFKNLKDFKQDGSLKSWFRRIIINTAIDHYRKEKRHLENVSIEEPSALPDEYEDIISALTVKDILKLLEMLSEDQRIIFNLYEIENYSHKEIGEILDISVGTSRSYLSRAKARLQKLFISNFGDRYERTV